MSTEKNDAVHPVEQFQHYSSFGLTKREYFAAMAMQGILADRDNQGYSGNILAIAHDAVKMADELIAQLNQIK